MKYIYIILFSVISVLYQSNDAQAEFRYKLPLVLHSDNGDSIAYLYYGVDDRATDTIDTQLGEKMLPDLPLMAGTLGGFFNIDTTTSISALWTYEDYRSVPENETHFYHEYKLISFWGLTKKDLTVEWGNLPACVDSAFFTDIIYGNIIRFDMKKQTKAVLNNSLITKYAIKMWFNKDAVSVRDIDQKSVLNIYPNPADNMLYIKSDKEIGQYFINDMLGNQISNGEISHINGEINISNLSKGVYFVKFINYTNDISFKQIVKR